MAKTWKKLASEALAGIYPAMEAMTDNELKLIQSAPKKANDSNCWWLTLRTITSLSGIASDILRQRRSDRRKAKKLARH